MSTPEGRVKAKVKQALKVFGTDCWYFMPVQSGFGRPALDFMCCIRGRMVAIETKAPGGELSPTQRSTKAMLELAGAIVLIVWDETSLELALKILLALEFSPNVDADTDGYHGDGQDGASLPTEAWRLYQQHREAIKSGKAPHTPAGGDHGASRKAPRRRALKGARGEDQGAAGG